MKDRFEPDAALVPLMDREALNREKGVPRQISDGEIDHFFLCAACGQAVDCRNLGDVLHHELTEHEPIGTQQ